MNIKNMYKPSKVEFLSEIEIKRQLHEMENDEQLNTTKSPKRYIDSSIMRSSFFKKHWTYLRTHPKVNPEEYLTNLRTMIRIRHP